MSVNTSRRGGAFRYSRRLTRPDGFEGSGAFRCPGSIVRVLRTERWVRPTERAGSEGSFICRCPWQRKPLQPPCGRGNAFPLWWLAPPPCPVGSVSLDSQSPTVPCESSSLATPSSRGHYQAPLCCERLMKGLLCRSLLSHKCRFPGDHRCLFFCYHTYRDTNISERTENYEAGNDRTGMHY